MSKTWFITGASKGFGHLWAAAALQRGDRVAATARDTSTLDDLVQAHGDAVLPLQLDVTDHAADTAAVQRAAEHFGRIDVVVNNAGYGHFGMIEELAEDEVRAQLETNLFGALWVTQAALPILRAQGSGHIVQVSSIGGISAFPGVGAYHASKWALEAFSQSLAQEVAGFGIHVTLVEPGGFSTDWSGPSASRSTTLDAYDEVRAARDRQRAANTPGDPRRPAPRSSRSSTPPRRPCASSSAPPRSVSRSGTTSPASRRGGSGSPWPSGPRGTDPTDDRGAVRTRSGRRRGGVGGDQYQLVACEWLHAAQGVP